jgi:hypothetical protein
MLVKRFVWSAANAWSEPLPTSPNAAPQLILSFGPVDAPPAAWFDDIRAHWPGAQHVYCSGGGQILDGSVYDDRAVVTVIEFDRATVHAVQRDGAELERSGEMGSLVGNALADVKDLKHILVFAEGLSLNGASFVTALNETLPDLVTVSGGLASNGLALSRTAVGLNGPPRTGSVVAVGLAGDSLSINTGSVGGWDFFGPERIVTRSDTAVVYELDGENALEVYKRYLGPFAAELPGVALIFPLAVWSRAGGPVAVRTILAIDEATGSLRFAGDVPLGSTVRLMRTTTDKLIDGAASAAKIAAGHDADVAASLTLCISCIGRRAVMRTRVEEELEEVLLASPSTPVVGFYSNGEIAPPSDGREFAQAVLHNQTMTVTSIGER